MIKAVAIDDDPIATKVVESFCNVTDFITLEKTFNDAQEGLRYLNKFPFDLLFLDIDMPKINGLNLLKKLKQDTMVIFTTTHTEYAVEGFNLRAVDYLVKPFTFDRFMQAVNKAQEVYTLQRQKDETGEPRYLFIRADYSLMKVPIASILYIEALDDYLKIYIENQRTVVARLTMKAMEEMLSPNRFIRVHRSFILPIQRIERVRKKVITAAGKEIPIGASYEKNVLSKFNP